MLRIHIAVLLFGLAGPLGKVISLPAPVIVLGRVVFALLFLLPAIAGRGQSICLGTRRDYFALAIQGVVLAGHWIAFFQAVRVSTVAVGLLTFATFPVFVAFLEPLVSHDQLRWADVMLATVALAGVALVVPNFDLGDATFRGAAWGMASGLTFALLSVLNRRYVSRYSSLVIAMYQDAVAALLLVPALFIYRPVPTITDVFLLGVLGVVFTGLAHSLFIAGMAGVRARRASVVAMLEPVYGIAVAMVMLGELPTLREVAGGIAILGAALWATLHR